MNEQPLYSVLHEQPNNWQTSLERREQSILHAFASGVMLIEIRSGTAGAVSELIPLHPSHMTVERIENGKLRYKYREPNGSETVYRQDQILHVRWMSGDGATGMIPVELAKDAVLLIELANFTVLPTSATERFPVSYSKPISS